MGDLIGRSVAVEIGVPGTAGTRIEGLRIGFDAIHGIKGDANKAQIKIYNPRAETIAALEAEGVIVRVLAGFRIPLQIFQGSPDVDGVSVERSGVDRVLTIQASDGGRVLLDSMVDITIDGPVTPGQLVELARDSLGVPRGPVSEVDTAVEWPAFSYSGRASGLLDDMSEVLGVDWSIRDGALALIDRAGDTGETAPLYSSASGTLAGAPKRLQGGGVEIRALLDNSMRPGRPFVLESEELSGVYVAEDVRHVGDSGWAADFFSIIKGRIR